MKIGSIEITSLVDGEIRVPPADTYADVAPERWAEHPDRLDAQGHVEFTTGGYLVRTGEHTVLVDLGAGFDPPVPFTGGTLLDRLAEVGTAPEDVDHVIITHLHFDHIGWASRDGRVVFPNAEHHLHLRDWEFFVDSAYVPMPMERAQDLPANRLAPLKDHVTRFTGRVDVVPGVRLRPAPGHTPGTTIVELESGGERGLLLGDVAHSAVELLLDGWPGIADVDAVQARRTAAEVAAELVETGVPFALAHAPGLTWTRLVEEQGRRSLVVLGR
ncbi:MBL fold metallo-hydrolase [Pseudonocardia sp. NPDC049154]|uniref:MBL fold metallo-hydrolase n=1 Tax=Pseudonocardia sp. NPDC049154 TaxID=3155501 RepID=UPI003401F965